MIYKLQRKFVLISLASVFTVVILVFGVIFALNLSMMNRNMDRLADNVSQGGGKFPLPFDKEEFPGEKPPKNEPTFEFITPETPFSTRYFTVYFDENNDVKDIFTDSIYSITDDQAVEYAKSVLNDANKKGWASNYRYKIFSTEAGCGVVFIDGSMNISTFIQSNAIAAVVLLVCAGLVLILIFLLSKKAVKPIAESYEKQKQFVTDAGHELKTPLTLILTNTDIAENELGKNEWLDDIRAEGNRMSELVNQLVALSKMDESRNNLQIKCVEIGELVSDTIAEFEPLAISRNKTIKSDINKKATCNADEALIYRLVGILMDNAIKYCDNDGEIFVSLQKGRKTVLIVENTYSAVNETEFNKLFDRFYRADKARKFTGGYGVGLSMAKSIVENHKGDISAYKKDNSHIVFKVVL